MKWKGEWKTKEKVRARRAVWVYAWELSRGKADVLYLPGNRRLLLQKPLFTGEAPVFTYKTLTASLAFWRLNLKQRFHTLTHTRMHTYKSAVRHVSRSKSPPPDSHCIHSVYFCTLSLQAVVGHGWKQGDILSDVRLEICHFKAWVKRPLWLLIGLSSSITPVLCIAPFIRAATATNTLNLSSFDLP